MPVTAFPDEWLAQSVEGLTPERLQELREKSNAGRTLWEYVVDEKIATDATIIDKLSHRFRLKIPDFSQIDRSARDSVPEQLARRHHVLPLRLTDSYLEIGTSNPLDLDAEKALAFNTAREIRLFLLSPSKISEKLDEMYKPEKAIDKLLEGMGDQEVLTTLSDAPAPEELSVSEADASQKPVVRLVDMIISEGILSRASDIHVEPEEGGVAVRYRIDGVLRQVMKIPRQAGLPLISRIKIMSSLDIADRLRPQDGRARGAVNGQPIDLRVSTLPAALGEKVVIRILDSRATVKSLDSLGLLPNEVEAILKLLQFHEGIILVTGPTGSGKTTTLYSMINQIKSEGVNIVTVEDPVEYRVQGIVQVQVQEKTGLTFASALRSILRQDPNVVLIGEIRDRETAQIAVQASLTGHLVLSTLHTNDAPNTVTRLVDMGMEACKIASALRGVLAQRLLRRLCQVCRAPQTDPLPERVRQYLPEGAELYQAVGCSECAHTGFRGRFGIVEILVMNPELERLIGRGATADKIAAAARANGMRSLFESGLRTVLAGTTSVEELLRVTEPPIEDGEADASRPAPRPEGEMGPTLTPQERRPQSEDAAPPAARGAPAKPSALAPPREVGGGEGSAGADGGVAGGLALEFSPAFELLDDLPPVRAEVTRKGSMVLLVDDEDQLRRVTRDLLERHGYTVVEARDGAQALEAVDRHAPDIILLDLNLPGVDGYSVLAELRSRPATRQLPIVVLTAKGDEDNEVRVLQLGADDFLTKPFRTRSLAARLENALSRRGVTS